MKREKTEHFVYDHLRGFVDNAPVEGDGVQEALRDNAGEIERLRVVVSRLVVLLIKYRIITPYDVQRIIDTPVWERFE